MTALTDADLDRLEADANAATEHHGTYYTAARMYAPAAEVLALIALARRAKRLEGALWEFIRWADRKCPCHNEEPNPCPLCGASVENLEPCKAADNTLPRRLLQETRAILSEPGA